MTDTICVRRFYCEEGTQNMYLWLGLVVEDISTLDYHMKIVARCLLTLQTVVIYHFCHLIFLHWCFVLMNMLCVLWATNQVIICLQIISTNSKEIRSMHRSSKKKSIPEKLNHDSDMQWQQNYCYWVWISSLLLLLLFISYVMKNFLRQKFKSNWVFGTKYSSIF